MTTVTMLRWDAFLPKQVERLPEAQRADALVALRRHIDRFRETDWPNIRREYHSRKDAVRIPDGLEPLWVGPGKAVYWHRQDVLGKKVDAAQERWEPTGPLPANNASQLAHHLGKGFRLRPPTGVDVEASESAVPPEGLQAPQPPVAPQFFCRTHPERGDLGFTTWKAYLRHCADKRETPDLTQLPDEVKRNMGRYEFYCLLHNVGYTTEHMAHRHLREELRKPQRPSHPSVEQMRVARVEVKRG